MPTTCLQRRRFASQTRSAKVQSKKTQTNNGHNFGWTPLAVGYGRFASCFIRRAIIKKALTKSISWKGG
jgi:hypothetical protein